MTTESVIADSSICGSMGICTATGARSACCIGIFFLIVAHEVSDCGFGCFHLDRLFVDLFSCFPGVVVTTATSRQRNVFTVLARRVQGMTQFVCNDESLAR